MPNPKMPSGNYKDVAHPIKSDTRAMKKKAVLDTFQALPELNEEDKNIDE